MSLLKFILYSLIAYLVIRFVIRIFIPPQTNRPQQTTNNQSGSNRTRQGSESLEKPKFTIEAESVDYEIIEEPKKKNEE